MGRGPFRWLTAGDQQKVINLTQDIYKGEAPVSMNELESPNMSGSTTVAFYPADGGKPLFICEMSCPPRVGESVKLPGGESGIVAAVDWEITSDNGIFSGVALRLVE